MAIAEKIRDEKKKIVIEEHQKQLHYFQEILINVNVLQVKKYYLLIKVEL